MKNSYPWEMKFLTTVPRKKVLARYLCPSKKEATRLALILLKLYRPTIAGDAPSTLYTWEIKNLKTARNRTPR